LNQQFLGYETSGTLVREQPLAFLLLFANQREDLVF
jgi:hypothetical protein